MARARALVERRFERPSALNTAAAALALAVTSWQFTAPAVIGIDESWQAALHLAGSRDLQFGVDVIFTYGPLGFLGFPNPIHGPGSALSFLAVTAVYAGLAFAILSLGLRSVSVVVALVAAAIASRLSLGLPAFEAALALVFVAAVTVVAMAGEDRRRWLLFAVLAGAVTGLGALGKVNVALFGGAALLVAALVLARPWWAGAGVFAVAASVGLLAGWLATGQEPANLAAYVDSSVEVVRGYAEAMIVDTHPANQWTYLAFVACGVILAWLGRHASSGWPGRRRVGLALIGAVVLVSQWKTGYSRNELGYTFATLAIVCLPLAALALRGGADGTGRLAPSAATLAIAAVSLVALATTHLQPVDVLNPYHPARRWIATAADVLVPGRLEAAVAATRSRLAGELELGEETLAAIGSGTVHVDPWQTIAVAAHPQLAWSPLPVIQSYSAFTPALDGANADRLRSAEAPQRILRERVDGPSGEPLAVDNRFVWFESPAATLETVCRYEELSASDRWQVLARTERTCGGREALGSVTALAGEAVEVPTAPDDRLVLVAIHGLEASLLDRIGSLVHRAPEFYVDLGPDRGEFRLVPGTAASGLLLSVPSSIGYSDRFAFGPPIESIAVSRGRDADPMPGLTYEFFAVRLAVPSEASE